MLTINSVCEYQHMFSKTNVLAYIFSLIHWLADVSSRPNEDNDDSLPGIIITTHLYQ